jgi:protein-disulfide isomerase
MRNIFKNLFLILIIGGSITACGDQSETKTIEKKPESITSETATEETKHVRGFGIEADDIVYGNPEASVIFVVYYSTTCPHCVGYHKRILPELKAKYIDTGKIAYVSREFIGNKQDFDATSLARCEGSVDSYTKFTHVILEQQESWAYNKNYREILTNLAGLGGISPDKYAACLKNKSIGETLMANTKLLTSQPGFVGTPSFFINGKQYTGIYTLEDLSTAIDAALADGS